MRRNTTIVLAVIVVVILAVAGALASGVLDLTSGDRIKYIDVPPVDQKNYIEQGMIDGAVGWEPYVSQAVVSGTAKVLIDSGDIWPDHPCCVLVANSKFARDNHDTALRLLKAHVEANKWISDAIENRETDPENYQKLLEKGSEFSGTSTEVVDRALQNMKLTYDITPETMDYLEMFTNQYISASLIQKNKISNVRSFVDSLVDTSFLDEVSEVSEASDSTLTQVRIGYLQGDLHQLARVIAEDAEIGGGKSLFERYGIETKNADGMPGGGYANGGVVMTNHEHWDMAYLGSPPVLLQSANQGYDVKILALANTEGSALIVAGDRGIEDLGGLTIGQPGASSIQYLLLVTIAEEYGYRLSR